MINLFEIDDHYLSISALNSCESHRYIDGLQKMLLEYNFANRNTFALNF